LNFLFLKVTVIENNPEFRHQEDFSLCLAKTFYLLPNFPLLTLIIAYTIKEKRRSIRNLLS